MRLHKKLGVENSVGLSNYLTGSCSPPDAIRRTVHKNLFFMSSGPLPPNAADLLVGSRLMTLLTRGLEHGCSTLFIESVEQHGRGWIQTSSATQLINFGEDGFGGSSEAETFSWRVVVRSDDVMEVGRRIICWRCGAREIALSLPMAFSTPPFCQGLCGSQK